MNDGKIERLLNSPDEFVKYLKEVENEFIIKNIEKFKIKEENNYEKLQIL